jgi:hypothetical protein
VSMKYDSHLVDADAEALEGERLTKKCCQQKGAKRGAVKSDRHPRSII